jgi:hypothetical protein
MRIFIAMTLGILTEATLIGLLIAGGIGPCGPASPIGGFVLMLHVPGMRVAQALHMREPLSLAVISVCYAAAWGALALLSLSALSRKDP